MENLYFLWQMVQQNYQEETTNSKNPGIHRAERISTENLMAIGKSFDLKKQKMTKETIRISRLTQKLGKNVIYRHLFEPRSSTNVPREGSFYIYKIYITERNSSEKRYTMRVENWRKAKTSEATTNSIFLILQGKDGILYLVTTLRKNSFL